MRFLGAVTLAFILILVFALTVESDAQPIEDYNKPDLTVNIMEFRDPDEYHMNAGERTLVSVSFMNSGSAKAEGNWTFSFFDNGRLIREGIIYRSLEPGESSWINFTFELRKGEREFKFIADSENDIEEMSEDNNEFVVVVIVDETESVIPWWTMIIAMVCGPLFAVGVFISVILFMWRMLREKK